MPDHLHVDPENLTRAGNAFRDSSNGVGRVVHAPQFADGGELAALAATAPDWRQDLDDHGFGAHIRELTGRILQLVLDTRSAHQDAALALWSHGGAYSEADRPPSPDPGHAV